MLKKDLIKENKNLLQQNKDLLYLLNFGKLECENSNHQLMWYQDSNAIVLKQQLVLYKSVINDIKHILNNQMDYREFVDIVNDIEEILERVNYEI